MDPVPGTSRAFVVPRFNLRPVRLPDPIPCVHEYLTHKAVGGRATSVHEQGRAGTFQAQGEIAGLRLALAAKEPIALRVCAVLI